MFNSEIILISSSGEISLKLFNIDTGASVGHYNGGNKRQVRRFGLKGTGYMRTKIVMLQVRMLCLILLQKDVKKLRES